MKRPTWLITLLEKGAVGHSSANPNVLSELINLGLVGVKTAGLRRRVVVADPSQLKRWLRARYPQHGGDPDSLPTRAGNIVRSGGSKTGTSAHAVLPVLFKWFGSRNERWSRLTREFGMAAVMTDTIARLTTPRRWRLLTIENWEPFYRADYTHAPRTVMVVYLGGNVSDALIEALATFAHPPEAVMHFGDYDWEGLYIFQRLQQALPSARLYIPDNLDALFKTFGDRQLIARQRIKAAFDRTNPACRPIIELIEQSNAGVEQEIVALPTEV